MAHVRYATYVSLRDKLKRLSKSHPVIGSSYSALATLVLDTALKNSGYIPKEVYYKTSFEKEGISYKEWILQLKKAGVFSSFKDEESNIEKSDWIRFKPGPSTIAYVNREKSLQNEMASMSDLHKVDARLSEEIDMIKNEIKDMAAKMEVYLKPPVTDENAIKATRLSMEVERKISAFGRRG
jgi:predicted nucleotidyltransferase